MEVSARLTDFVPLPLLSIDFLLHVINGYSHAGFTDGTVIFAFTVIFRTGTVFKKQYQ